MSYTSDKQGIGGWLAFLVFVLLVGTPLFGATRIVNDIQETEKLYPNLLEIAAWADAKAAMWGIFLVQATASIAMGIALLNRRTRSTVNMVMLGMWIFGPVAAIVSLIVVFSFSKTGGPPPASFNGVIIGCLVTTFWTVYLSSSARVKATYPYADVWHTVARPKKNVLSLPVPTRRILFYCGAWIAISWLALEIFDPFYHSWGSGSASSRRGMLAIFGPIVLYVTGTWIYPRFVRSNSK